MRIYLSGSRRGREDSAGVSAVVPDRRVFPDPPIISRTTYICGPSRGIPPTGTTDGGLPAVGCQFSAILCGIYTSNNHETTYRSAVDRVQAVKMVYRFCFLILFDLRPFSCAPRTSFTKVSIGKVNQSSLTLAEFDVVIDFHLERDVIPDRAYFPRLRVENPSTSPR